MLKWRSIKLATSQIKQKRKLLKDLVEKENFL